MNATEALARLLADPTALPDAELLDALRAEYPYLTLPAALALKRGADRLDPALRAELSSRVALNAAGRDTLFRLLDPDGDIASSLESRPEPVAATPTTDSAIDLFLDTYGRIDPREEALLEKMIFNPVPDYASVLERESAREAADSADPSTAAEPVAANSPASEQDRLLDAFLAAENKPAESKPEEPTAPEPAAAEPLPAKTRANVRHHADTSGSLSGTLSESLARIYIRQRRFDKAYDIIHNLSLNNPEKSVYFADQLRFLRKLMLNAKYRNS